MKVIAEPSAAADALAFVGLIVIFQQLNSQNGQTTVNLLCIFRALSSGLCWRRWGLGLS